MTERLSSFYIRCLNNPQRVCPISCKLHLQAKAITKACLERSNLSKEELVRTFDEPLSLNPENLGFPSMDDWFKENGYSSLCERYPEIEFDLPD